MRFESFSIQMVWFSKWQLMFQIFETFYHFFFWMSIDTKSSKCQTYSTQLRHKRAPLRRNSKLKNISYFQKRNPNQIFMQIPETIFNKSRKKANRNVCAHSSFNLTSILKPFRTSHTNLTCSKFTTSFRKKTNKFLSQQFSSFLLFCTNISTQSEKFIIPTSSLVHTWDVRRVGWGGARVIA